MKLSHLSSNRSEFSTIEFDSDSVSRDFEATVYPAAALPKLGGMGRCDSDPVRAQARRYRDL